MKKSSSHSPELDRYYSEIEKYPVLSRDKEKELAIKAQNGDKAAKDILIVSNLRFVVQIAHLFSGYLDTCGISTLDLIQEGTEGLITAVDKFNPEKGNRLISYAVYWIKVKMYKLAMNGYSLIKIGTTGDERKMFFKLGKLTEIIFAKNEEKVELRSELAKEVKMTLNKVKELEDRFYSKEMSVDTPTMQSSMQTHLDTLEESNPWMADQEHKIAYNQVGNYLEKAIKELNEKEEYIVRTRWLSNKRTTLSDIGRKYNVSKEWIRQIETSAFKKIKKSLFKQGLVSGELHERYIPRPK